MIDTREDDVVILETKDDESEAWNTAEEYIAMDRKFFTKDSPHTFGVKTLFTKPNWTYAVYVNINLQPGTVATEIPLPAEAKQVLAVIRIRGGRPMIAGGYPRDYKLSSLRGTKLAVSADIDIEAYNVTDLDALIAALKKLPGADVGEVGKVYGVVKVRIGSVEMDVSLPRHEVNTGAGHRGFAVISDSALGFEAACARRNYTVCAMLVDPFSNELVDPCGGRKDLKKGILRHVSPRFSEDPLRVLIGMQLAARFGFKMAPETIQLCRGLAVSYPEISKERIWGEWEKLVTKGTHMSAGLSILVDTGWIELYPQLSVLHLVPQDPEWHPEGNVLTHTILAADQAARLADEAGLTGGYRAVPVLAALCHDMGKAGHTQVTEGRITSHGHDKAGVEPASEFLASIGCPGYIAKRVLPLVREHMNPVTAKLTKHAVRRLVRRLEPASMTQLHMLVGADHKGRGNPAAPNPADSWLEMAKGLSIEEKPRKGLLTGDHLIEAGLKPGPNFKEILAAALEAQDEGEFETDMGAVAWLARRMISDLHR